MKISNSPFVKYMDEKNFGIKPDQIDLISSVRSRLENSKIPSQIEKDEILGFAENLQNSATEKERQEQNQKMLEELISLKEAKYFDQRLVFKEKEVVNKGFIKEITKHELLSGNNNLTRISIDVEGLKTVNDVMGHEAGDKYLALVYEKIEKTIDEIKKQNPELCEELDFYISAEGGDEFGILVVGKKDGQTDLSLSEFKIDVADKSDKPLDQAINEILSDGLSEIKVQDEGILDKEKVKERFASIYRNRYEKYIERLTQNLEENQVFLERKVRRYEKEILARSRESNIQKVGDEKKLSILKEMAREERDKKLAENEERFQDYNFFASASAGEAVMSELIDEDGYKEFIKNKTKELMRKSGLPKEKAEALAKMDALFSEADDRMNQFKALFKKQARNTIMLGDKYGEGRERELYLKGRDLTTHILVLSRSDEQIELLLELEELIDETQEANAKVVELKVENKKLREDLDDCEVKLAA